MNKSRLLVLGAAIAISLLCARAAFKYMEKPEPGNVSVVVASQDISPGQALTGAMIKMAQFPKNDAPAGAISDPGEVVGLIAATRIYKSEPIKRNRLTSNAPEPKSSFFRRLEEGSRAVSISIDAVSGLAGNIKENDRVDVIATSSAGDEGAMNISRLLMENIRVLKVGKSRKRRDNPASFKGTATLSVTPAQAAILAAAEDSRIILVLRSETDLEPQRMETTQFSPETGVMTESQAKALARGRLEQIQQCIGKGSRAVTIQYTDEDGICGKLHPKDRVDIIATHTFFSVITHGKQEAGEPLTVKDVNLYSKTVMQNLEVMAIEEDVSSLNGFSYANEDSSGKKKDSPSIVQGAAETKKLLLTLLASPKDAEKLAVLSEASKIKLVLRNQGDDSRVETEGEVSGTLFKKEKYHGVEVYDGEVRGEKLFQEDENGVWREKRAEDPTPDDGGVI